MSREVEAGIGALPTHEENMADPARPHAHQRSGGPAPRRDRQNDPAQGADPCRGRSLGPGNASTRPGHFANYAIGTIEDDHLTAYARKAEFPKSMKRDPIRCEG
ncbi:hypothetical protein ACIFUY_26170 [Streptomyces sp. CACIS-1.16CA]|uniref:hypothetical protein n=1 Tax=Streptomyces sp. CACIS-1.16CA TaxID=1175510 RepID=UPI0037D6E5DA